MKIAVSASDMSLTSQVDPRFGRCEYLLIVDTEDMNIDAFPNKYKDMSGGAGTQAASFVAEKGGILHADAFIPRRVEVMPELIGILARSFT